jgi:cation:H+ antiporter
LSVLLLFVGFFLVIEGASLLVDGGSSLARRLHISDLAVGLTVIAFGTSLPELSVNIAASIKGTSEIAITNVLGSNTANILLILGISSIIFPLAVTKGTVWKEIPFSLLAAVVLALLAANNITAEKDYSKLTRIDGFVLLSFFIIFLYYTAGIAHQTNAVTEQIPAKNLSLNKSIFFIVGGLVLLIFGGSWIVSGAIDIAGRLHISESAIGATIVAVGTSIPELATSVAAATKKNADIAVGNVIGSNIFNIFFILGISALIRPLTIHSSDIIHFAAVIIANIALFVFMFTGKRRLIDRWEGWLLLAGYILYITLVLV